MKTLFISMKLSLALCGAVGVAAQNVDRMGEVDAMQVSQTVDGDYLVRKYIVSTLDDNDYSVRYQISESKLEPGLDGNKRMLTDLDKFISALMADTLANVLWVEVAGYASPDGPMPENERLAKNRTADFMAYVDGKYDFSRRFRVQTAAVADDWSAIREAVVESDIPNQADVLEVIDSNAGHLEKEAQLQQIPGVWDYLKANILPPMRRVELAIGYGARALVEERTLIPQQAPKLVKKCCAVVDDSAAILFVEMPDSDLDFAKMNRQEQKVYRQMEKAARKEIRLAEKLDRREARAAEKLARQLDRQMK